jgi:hypothetical protein
VDSVSELVLHNSPPPPKLKKGVSSMPQLTKAASSVPNILQQTLQHASSLAQPRQRSAPKEMFLRCELEQRVPALPAPRGECTFHIYVSPHNLGAADLMHEVASQQQEFNVKVAHRFADLSLCERMLIYLTSRTWTSGERSNDKFADEVRGDARTC